MSDVLASDKHQLHKSIQARSVRAGSEAEPISQGLVAKQFFRGKKLKPLKGLAFVARVGSLHE